jgi:hypothetical protein
MKKPRLETHISASAGVDGGLAFVAQTTAALRQEGWVLVPAQGQSFHHHIPCHSPLEPGALFQ